MDYQPRIVSRAAMRRKGRPPFGPGSGHRASAAAAGALLARLAELLPAGPSGHAAHGQQRLCGPGVTAGAFGRSYHIYPCFLNIIEYPCVLSNKQVF